MVALVSFVSFKTYLVRIDAFFSPCFFFFLIFYILFLLAQLLLRPSANEGMLINVHLFEFDFIDRRAKGIIIMKSILWRGYVETELTQNITDIGCDDLLSINHRKNTSPPPPAISLRVVYIPSIYIGVSAQKSRCVVLLAAFHERRERERSTNGQCDHMQKP